MSTTTPRYGLIKNAVTDYQDDAIVANQAANMEKIEQELGEREDAMTAHQTAAELAHPNSSVTDVKIGNRTIADNQAPGSATGLLSVLLNGIGYIIKAITGKANWYTAPAISLETLSIHKTRHQPGGADALPTAAPAGLGTAAQEGASTSFARADHVHAALDSTNPADVGTAAAPGSATVAARRDHVHKLGAGSATDTAIGNRTISDASAPTGDSGAITTLFGWLAYMIKAITGKSNWRTAPAINLESVNGKFDGTTGHNHDGTAGKGPKIGSGGLANDAATDTIIGNRTIADTSAPTSDTGTLTNLFSWLGYMIKAITGKSNWRMAPATTLEAASTFAPPGMIAAFGRDTAPAGWLECNGTEVSRTTYAALFAAIGTTFGNGDGSTTFNLPDLRGEFIRGWDHLRGIDPARALGSAQSDQLKSHTHSVVKANYDTGTSGGSATGIVLDERTPPYDVSFPFLSSTGGTETRPRNVALMYCIKF